MTEPIKTVLEYHQRSKHHFHRTAPGPGYLDWANQPDPFRRYPGAPLLALDKIRPGAEPLYEPAFLPGNLPPARLDRASVSQLFYDSLAISAWKQAGESRWALRVNPSSGNLHPTEGYLVCGPIPGLTGEPIVAHYAPKEHGLEIRAMLPVDLWQELTAEFPPGTLFIGFSSIHWREAWKYGVRAFRYCQHDVGHALGAVSIAAAGLGWGTRLLDGLASTRVAELLGLAATGEAEPEHPDCLLAVFPAGSPEVPASVPAQVFDRLSGLEWLGVPNVLSEEHVVWPGIAEVAGATGKTAAGGTYPPGPPFPPLAVEPSPISLRRIIRRRRSAVDMDARTGITRAAFYQILLKTLAGPGQAPFQTLPWSSQVDLVLFVHRVQELDPGLYCLVRDPRRTEELRAGMRPDFAWESPPDCPAALPLFRLLTADARSAAARLSCGQDIAADGCFSLGMLACFEGPLREYGPWFYPRLFWECGMIGQVLYLEAEASGIRATGIGCYFDDPVHDLLGLDGSAHQSLYHFTLGGAIDDPRLTTLPAYPEQ